MERHNRVNMKDLIFVIESPNPGSCKVKGMQPAEHFNVESPISSDINYAECRDTIMVFIGSLALGHNLNREKIEDLQSRDNIILNDPVDAYCYFNPWGDNPGTNEVEYLCATVIDGIFTPNTEVLKNLESIVKKDCFLQNMPHNLDKHFFDIPQEKNDFFSIGYGGHPYPNEFFNNKPVPYLEMITTGHNDDVLKFCKQHTCHFSHRKSDTLDFMLKPASKVIVASVCGSPIVTSKDWSVMDLLPKGYPLLVSDDRKDVIEKIEYAKSIFGTAKWSELLDIHKEIKEKTSLDYLQTDYLKVFNHFGWDKK